MTEAHMFPCSGARGPNPGTGVRPTPGNIGTIPESAPDQAKISSAEQREHSRNRFRESGPEHARNITRKLLNTGKNENEKEEKT